MGFLAQAVTPRNASPWHRTVHILLFSNEKRVLRNRSPKAINFQSLDTHQPTRKMGQSRNKETCPLWPVFGKPASLIFVALSRARMQAFQAQCRRYECRY